jgi:hypothetical protein
MKRPPTKKTLQDICRRRPNCPRARKALAHWYAARQKTKEAKAEMLRAKKLEERRNKMVVEHQGLIGLAIRLLANTTYVAKRTWQDNYSDGQLGLMRAAELWVDGRGLAWTTFASLCIRGWILHYAHRDRLVWIPRQKTTERYERERAVAESEVFGDEDLEIVQEPHGELRPLELALEGIEKEHAALLVGEFLQGNRPAEMAKRLGLSMVKYREARVLALNRIGCQIVRIERSR